MGLSLIEFLIFTNGTQCNTALLGDFIMEVASSHPDDLMLEPSELKPTPAPKPKPVKIDDFDDELDGKYYIKNKLD